MQTYRIWHTALSVLLLTLWVGGPLGTFLKPLFAKQPVHCHCPGHAKRTLPTGPTFAPCEDGSALEASAGTPPVAELPESPRVTVTSPRVVGADHQRFHPQAVPSVESPPPRRAV